MQRVRCKELVDAIQKPGRDSSQTGISVLILRRADIFPVADSKVDVIGELPEVTS